MHKQVEMMHALGMALIVVFCGLVLVFPAKVQAQSKVAAEEAVSYNVNGSMADNLKSLTGKRVVVTLDSGKSFGGIVKAVGDHLVHLEKLEGKEFFDALILIEDIGAIDTRFRSN